MTPWGHRPQEAAGGGQDWPLPRGARSERGALLSGANGVASPHTTAVLHEAAGDCGPRQEADAGSPAARGGAGRGAAGGRAAGRAGRAGAGRPRAGEAEVRPAKAAPSAGAGARLPRVIPLLVAAPPGEAERRRRGSPLGVSAVCCPVPRRGPRLFAPDPRTPSPAARRVLSRAPRPPPRTPFPSARPVPLRAPRAPPRTPS